MRGVIVGQNVSALERRIAEERQKGLARPQSMQSWVATKQQRA
jgi:hypothetical protein